LRVLLISTPHPLDENPLPPLSLAYLAGALKRSGAEVQILDFLVARYDPEKVRRTLEAYRPQLVGVTCVTMNYPRAAEILRVCKAVDGSIVTVIGGPHVSFAWEDTLLSAPWIDAVVIGEGEATIVELAAAVAGGDGIAGVPGIAFARDGAAVRTKARPRSESIDALAPPARHLIPLARYRALGTPCTVITSRGCPYSCAFCSAHRMFGRRVRFRDPGLVVDEIEAIQRDFGFPQVNIVDDTFTFNHSHVRQVCEEMLRRNLEIRWSAYARVDNMTEELVRLMRRAGCEMVLFGLESADEVVLKTIRKGSTPDQMREGVRIAAGAGLKVYNSFIIGLPGESRETVRKSISLAEELNSRYGAEYGFHVLSPLPGTDLYERAADYGLRILSRDWADYDANHVIVESDSMSPADANEVITYYDEIVEHAWSEIRSRAERGDTACMERLAQMENRAFVWSLLQEDIIETAGTFSAGREAEAELARHIAPLLALPEGRVRHQVAELCHAGLLQTVPDPAGWRWRWSEGVRAGQEPSVGG
jgi:radical SAM superfamily enzyme YgiQ (UPF0313 family)